MKLKTRFKILGLAVVLAVFVTPPAKAAEFLKPAGQDGNLVVAGETAHKNLYAAGANLTVVSKILGDLYAVGGTLSVSSPVEADLALVGGNLIVSGPVGGDARLGGGNIQVMSPIAGDLLAGGGNITLSDKASVGGDFVAGGGNIIINSPVKGVVRLAGGNAVIASKIAGNVYAQVSKQLVFEPGAEVAGKVFYTGPGEPVVKPGAKVGEIQIKPLPKSNFGRGWKSLLATAVLFKLLAWFLAGLLLVKFMPRRVGRVTSTAYHNPWQSLGRGFLALLAIPVAALLGLAILVGYYASAILLAWYVFALLLSGLFAAVFAGALIVKLLTKRPEISSDWQSLLIGVVAILLLSFIPVVGWLAILVLWLMAFGGVITEIKDHFLKE